jgi:hypothetical protein
MGKAEQQKLNFFLFTQENFTHYDVSIKKNYSINLLTKVLTFSFKYGKMCFFLQHLMLRNTKLPNSFLSRTRT